MVPVMPDPDPPSWHAHKRAAGPASAWIVRFSHLVRPGGAVLDVAAGEGRHARHFLGRGHDVTMVDRDVAGLQSLVGVAGAHILAHDLEDGSPWPFVGRCFDAVVVTNYLHRPLFEPLLAAIAPAGVLLYETFAAGNERLGRPRNPDHLLKPGELLTTVAGRLHVVAYEHGRVADGRSFVIQRICAVGPAAVPEDLWLDKPVG